MTYNCLNLTESWTPSLMVECTKPVTVMRRRLATLCASTKRAAQTQKSSTCPDRQLLAWTWEHEKSIKKINGVWLEFCRKRRTGGLETSFGMTMCVDNQRFLLGISEKYKIVISYPACALHSDAQWPCWCACYAGFILYCLSTRFSIYCVALCQWDPGRDCEPEYFTGILTHFITVCTKQPSIVSHVLEAKHCPKAWISFLPVRWRNVIRRLKWTDFVFLRS